MAKVMNFRNPVFKKDTHQMTLDFGYTYKNGGFHKGIDLITGRASDVVAFEDGKVVNASNSVKGTNTNKGTLGMGNYVILQHENGFRTRYQHMKYGSVRVKKGDIVKKGQVLGVIGNTGYSTGRHLHFDISNSRRLSGSFKSGSLYYIDPKPYLYGYKVFSGEVKKYSKNYVVKSAVNVRKGAGKSFARVQFGEMTPNAQEQIKKLAGKPVSYFPKGMKLTITEEKGRWGKCPSGWVSLGYLTEI